jgi:hypothetical protein
MFYYFFVLIVLIKDSICTTCTVFAFSFHLNSLLLFLVTKSVSRKGTPIYDIALLANYGFHLGVALRPSFGDR